MVIIDKRRPQYIILHNFRLRGFLIAGLIAGWHYLSFLTADVVWSFLSKVPRLLVLFTVSNDELTVTVKL